MLLKIEVEIIFYLIVSGPRVRCINALFQIVAPLSEFCYHSQLNWHINIYDQIHKSFVIHSLVNNFVSV